MAYGKFSKRKNVKRNPYTRGGAARVAGSSYRFKKRNTALARARKYKPTAKRNRTLAVSNARAIKRLRRQALGPVQRMTSQLHFSGSLHAYATKPLLIHVNNVATGSYGPKVITLDSNGATEEVQNCHFTPFYGHHDHLHSGPQFQDDHVPNGPKIFLKKVQFRLKFTGRLDNCHVRIDVIRQKRLVTPFWKDTALKQHLPHTLNSLQKLAGFTPNFLPKEDYQVLKRKSVFINSRGTRSAKDQALHVAENATEVYDARQASVTTQATTTNQRLVTITVPINRTTKQLESSVHEATGDDSMQGATATTEVGAGSGGNYRYNNIHPLANIWLLISTDDTNSEVNSLNDQLSVEMIRYCEWRDPVD